jgi:hypothetical protein
MGREAASEPLTSEGNEISTLDNACNLCMNTSLSTAVISALKTSKSSTLKQTLDCYFDSMNQTENSQLDELLARPIFS